MNAKNFTLSLYLLLLLLGCSLSTNAQTGVHTYEGSPQFPKKVKVLDATEESVNTENLQSLYKGVNAQPSPDVFYTFTLDAPYDVTISTCQSSFDTYIHLLDRNQNQIESNDDNGPECEVRDRASLKKRLEPGIYYLVIEGYSSNKGTATTAFKFQQFYFSLGKRIIEPGAANFEFFPQNTKLNVSGYKGPNAQPSPDITFEMDFPQYTFVYIHTCTANFDTYLHLLDANNNLIESNDDNPICESSPDRSLIRRYLPAGKYYLVAEGYNLSSGDLNLSFLFVGQGVFREGADENVATELTLSPNPASQNVHINTSFLGDTKLYGY